MSAADALEVLIDPANLIGFPTVTIPEGLRLTEIVSTLAKNTDFRAPAWNRALKKPAKIGLPDYADGNAEGYLFPATYEIKPGMKPVAILKMMVNRWRDRRRGRPRGQGRGAWTHSWRADDHRLSSRPRAAATTCRRSPGSSTTGSTAPATRAAPTAPSASTPPSPTDWVSRPASTELMLTSCAGHALQHPDQRRPAARRPIEAPGRRRHRAAANPADGDWYYYVTVDLSTGETKFYDDYDGFLTAATSTRRTARPRTE